MFLDRGLKPTKNFEVSVGWRSENCSVQGPTTNLSNAVEQLKILTAYFWPFVRIFPRYSAFLD